MKTGKIIWRAIVALLMVALDCYWCDEMLVNNPSFTLVQYLFWGFVSTAICFVLYLVFTFFTEEL